MNRSSVAVPVSAVCSTGGEITNSVLVVKTTGSRPADPAVAPSAVVTWVPAGTATGCSSGADSQNVRSACATDGGNGSMPTMFRKCT